MPNHRRALLSLWLSLVLLPFGACQCSTTDAVAKVLSIVMPLIMPDPAKPPVPKPPVPEAPAPPQPSPPPRLAPASTRRSIVSCGPASVHGALPAKKALEILTRHQNELRFCHESQTATPDNVQLKLKIIVSPLGAVQTAHVDDSDSNDSGFDACIAAAARRWTFPAASGGGIAVIESLVRFAGSSE